MDFISNLLVNIAYAVVIVSLLVALFFGVLKIISGIGKLSKSEGLHHSSVNFADKLNVGIIENLKKLKIPIISILLILIVLFSYVDYDSIAKPINFKNEKTKRYAAVIQRLKDIRTAQVAYKEKYLTFTGDFNTLINFVKFDSLLMVRNMGSFNEDTMTEADAIKYGIILRKLPAGLTAEEAVKKGFVVRDTIKVAVLDSIFPKNFPIDSLKYIPFTSKAVFKLGASVVTTGDAKTGVKVQVFEAVDTKPFDIYDTLKVGSLTEANNNSGNWE
jgi:hypothetical protein